MLQLYTNQHHTTQPLPTTNQPHITPNQPTIPLLFTNTDTQLLMITLVPTLPPTKTVMV